MESPVPLTNGHTTNGHELISTKLGNGLILRQPEWSIKASPRALNTVNPIRKIVEGLNLNPNKEKPFIPLSIGKLNVRIRLRFVLFRCRYYLMVFCLNSGDPTVFGNFEPCEEITDSMVEVVKSCRFNGYQPASGREDARQAVADYCALYGMDVTSKVGNLCAKVISIVEASERARCLTGVERGAVKPADQAKQTRLRRCHTLSTILPLKEI